MQTDVMPSYWSTNENAWMHLKKKHFSAKKAHLFIYRFKLPVPYKSLSKVRTSESCHAINTVNHAVLRN